MWRYELLRRPVTLVMAVCVALSAFLASCVDRGEECPDGGGAHASGQESCRQALRAQRLRNLSPGGAILPELQLLVDSMSGGRHDVYYYSAVNVLVDQLFGEGRFAEADSLAVRSVSLAGSERYALGEAIGRRIRGQMFYKLGQNDSAAREFGLAARLAGKPGERPQAFSNAASIYEWQWICARAGNDSAAMDSAAAKFSEAVSSRLAVGWSDSTAHFPVTALAFDASRLLHAGERDSADMRLREAGARMRADLPPRAYEHYYEVKGELEASLGNWDDALACLDTLVATHEAFPWFKVQDMQRRAAMLERAGRHAESAAAYKGYAAMHDSLRSAQVARRLRDLTVLYRTELDREQQRVHRTRVAGLAVALALVALLLAVCLLAVYRQRVRNRVLVNRLREADMQCAASLPENASVHTPEVGLTEMERLDLYMTSQRPYADPSLGRRELAAHIGCSPEHIGALIRRERGLSVLAYINAHRLDEARRMLAGEPSASVAEVAARLGFGTPRTLQRGFKERFGMSPSQYRQCALGS